MEDEHHLLTATAKLVGIKSYQLAYLLTAGIVDEPKLRIGGRRVFTTQEIERIREIVAQRRKEAK